MKARELIALGHIHPITNPNRSSIPRNHTVEETRAGHEIKLPQPLPLSETAGSCSQTETKDESHSFQRSTSERGPDDWWDDEDEGRLYGYAPNGVALLNSLFALIIIVVLLCLLILIILMMVWISFSSLVYLQPT